MKALILFVLLLHSAIAAFCQVVAETDPRAHIIIRTNQIDLVVDTPRDLMMPLSAGADDIAFKYLPSGKSVQLNKDRVVAVPSLTTGSFRRFSVGVVRDTTITLPEKGDTQFEVEVRNLTYSGAGMRETLQANGMVYDSTNIKNLVRATSEALAPEKTTEEKDLFAGFNIGIPSKDGTVQGDIVFNHTIVSLPAQLRPSIADSGSFGFKLKKGSEDGKDPRHFSLGFNFRKTKFRANPTEIATIRDAIDNQNPANALETLNDVRSRFFRAYLADYGLQMEGDVSQKGLGQVSNWMADLKFQIATAAIGFLAEKGYFTLRLIPAGVELGRNIANPNKATQEIGSLGRFKAGDEIKIYYENDEEDSALQRVELNVATVYRRLFQDEVAYDAKTKTNVSSKRRDMTWTQADFKIFLGSRIGNIRPGLKATFQRGYLPPVFARTKTFTYGFVFESLK